jgi:uncharacterized protein DUF5615
VKWLADENFRNAIIRGILRQTPTFDIIRAQDIPQVSGKDDRALLEFATSEGRIVVTHDLSTMIPAMRSQMAHQRRCAPIVFVPDMLPVGAAAEDILLLDECAREADWAAGVIYIPLR